MRVLTNDVFCAAWLMTQGARLVDLLVDRTPARASGTFVLDGDDLLARQEAYSRGGSEAVAPVKDIRDAVTHLRACLARALRQPAPRRSSEARSASL